MMSNPKYSICLVTGRGAPHASCFLELAMLLRASFLSLGYESVTKVNAMDPERTNIILGANFLDGNARIPPCPYIVYQLEQLGENEGWFSPKLERILRGAAAVWDYSAENVAFLASRGIGARHVPIGYHELLERVPHAAARDIDVLFYGSINERRQTLLNRLLRRRDIASRAAYNLYGRERDAAIGRARMVLNVHFYSTRIFEAVRVSYLLNNRCFVLSEDSAVYPYDGVPLPLVPYDRIVDACAEYLDSPARMEEVRDSTHSAFRDRYPMPAIIEKALRTPAG